MKFSCSPVTKLVFAAVLLLSASLGCNLFRESPPIPEPTLEAQQVVSPSPEQPSPNTTSPTSYQVFIDPSGTLYFITPSQIIYTINAAAAPETRWGFLEALSNINLTAHGVYWLNDAGAVPVARRVDLNGGQQLLSPPITNGVVVNVIPSPQGDQLAWLIEVSEIDPNPFEECLPENGCEGWNYEIYLTDMDGLQPRLVSAHSGGAAKTQPTLEMLGWKKDGSALFLRWNSNVPGMFYPALGGEIFEMQVSTGVVETLAMNWSATRSISPDGVWVITMDDHDNGIALEFNHREGGAYTIATGAGYPYLVSEPVFNGAMSYAYWIALKAGGASITDLEVHAMNLANGQYSVLADVLQYYFPGAAENQLPYFGSWVDANLITFHYAGGSLLLDVQSGAISPVPGSGLFQMPVWYLGTLPVN